MLTAFYVSLWCAVACCLLPAALFGQPDGGRLSLYRAEVRLEGDGTPGPYALDDHLLVVGSDTVWVNGAVQARGGDYAIDCARAQITFTRPIPKGGAIWARFRRIPIDLKPVYRHREAVAVEPTSGGGGSDGEMGGQGDRGKDRSLAPSPRRPVSLSGGWGDGGAGLRVGGSKTFSVSVGSNRDLSVDQALRVDLSGKISPGVEVVALLSDQNTPIQPEGNTKDLQEIDRVLIQIKSSHFGASLGDLDLAFEGPEFARYQRRLSGAVGRLTLPQTQFTIVGAVSQGEFRTQEIRPIEGNQGPYPLTAPNGDDGIVVLAGTERVWLDGEPLTRGEGADYTMDYSRAQITFTPRRLIAAESRIVVDYQYTDRRFKRNLIAGQGAGDFRGGKAHIGVTWIQESDGGEASPGETLSLADKAILRAAGDDPASAWRRPADSAEQQGSGPRPPEEAGRGGYRLVTDPSGWTYYRFDPLQTGSRVRFSFVGPGRGDYRYVGGGIYEYAGPDAGSYRPGVALPLPTRHSVTAFDLSLKPIETLQLSGEAAVSALDRNVFSPQDDGDNVGRAYKAALALRPEPLRAFGRTIGRIEAAGQYRGLGRTFQPLSRMRGVEEGRRWGLSLVSDPVGESTGEFRMAYRPPPVNGGAGGESHLDVEYGATRRGDLRSRRRAFEAQVSEEGWPDLHYLGEWLSVRGDTAHPSPLTTRTRHQAGVGHTLSGPKGWRFKPEVRMEAETVNRQSSIVNRENPSIEEFTNDELRMTNDGLLPFDLTPPYQEIEGELSALGRGPLSGSAGYGVRRTERITGGGDASTDSAVARTQRYRVDLKEWRALSLSGGYTRRSRRSVGGTEPDQGSDLGEVRVNFTPFEGAVAQEIRYEIANTQTAQKRRNFIEVGVGRGSYRWEDRNGDGLRQDEEFISDPDGPYLLYVERIGDFTPATAFNAGVRLQWEPGRMLNGTRTNADKRGQTITDSKSASFRVRPRPIRRLPWVRPPMWSSSGAE